ncbi:MAG: dihydroorotase, partial [Gammaproteobacteria bacterium]|nr:dihydroorotase [Gammaproteobacteria bacterium]
LVPPVSNRKMAEAYRDRILAASPDGSDFNPLMTLYLTNQTTVEDISTACSNKIPAAKLYPAGATTNSDAAVSAIEELYPVFERMSEIGMLLLVHGEVTDAAVDIFDREQRFIDKYLVKIHERFPSLKIVLEHITTSDAVEFVLSADVSVAATITPQHLLLNRNDLLAGGIRPHNYCLPVLKRGTHQHRLREVIVSGSSKFFLGSDSAPHKRHLKESSCGCAGCYSAWGAIELYAEVFDDLGALDRLEGFASHYGPDFYGMQRNSGQLTLVRDEWTMPEVIALENGEEIVPFYAGKKLAWRVRPTLDNS